jgi:hypothetical protein
MFDGHPVLRLIARALERATKAKKKIRPMPTSTSHDTPQRGKQHWLRDGSIDLSSINWSMARIALNLSTVVNPA